MWPDTDAVTSKVRDFFGRGKGYERDGGRRTGSCLGAPIPQLHRLAAGGDGVWQGQNDHVLDGGCIPQRQDRDMDPDLGEKGCLYV